MISRIIKQVIITASFVAALSHQTAAAGFERLISFGDSYTDQTNHGPYSSSYPSKFVSFDAFPSAAAYYPFPYFLKTYLSMSDVNFFGYGTSGATVWDYRNLGRVWLKDQIDAALKEPFLAGDLISINIGVNDINRHNEQPAFKSVNDAKITAEFALDQVARLIQNGAKTIVFTAPSSFGFLPKYQRKTADTFALVYFDELQRGLPQLVERDTMIYLIDIHRFFKDIGNTAGKYNFKHYDTVCPSGPPPCGSIKNGPREKWQNDYVFRDYLHPSTGGFKALAEYIADEVAVTSIIDPFTTLYIASDEIKGDVVNEGTLVISRQGDHNYSGAISGHGSVHVVGDGKFSFDGSIGSPRVTEHKKRLYTFLYRSLLAPNVASDVNGEYMSFKHEVSKTREGQVYYANYSAWDTYRSLAPFQALFFPKEAGDMAQSLVDVGKVCGAIPRWSNNDYEMGVMPGDSGPIIVAQTYAFGARNFDTASARELMLNAADNPTTNCQGNYINWGRTSQYFYGYAVSEGWGPTSTTIEYANGDFAVGNFAKLLGDHENGDRLIARAQSWKNLFNTSRWTNGSIVEGTAEQYMWMVPYDLGGLVDSLGGPNKTSDRLDKFFTYINAGQGDDYAYLGNEPSFTSPWVYNWAHNPAGTQKVVRRMINEVFSLKPDGLAGNDDLGSLSVMYVWGAIGLYPEIPGVPGFALHSPVFPKTTLALADGTKKVLIDAPAAPAAYIKEMTLDGVLHDSTWLPLDKLFTTREVGFKLGAEATQWGALQANEPLSPAKGKNWTPPVFKGVQAAFNNCGIRGTAGSCITASLDRAGNSYNGTNLELSDTTSEGLKLVAGLFDPLPRSAKINLGRDNVIAYGQTITFDEPLEGNTLFILGSGTDGSGDGTATLTFDDNTTQTVKLSLPDWSSNNTYTKSTAQPKGTTDADKLGAFVSDGAKGNGYRVVYKATGRLDWQGKASSTAHRIFYQSFNLGGQKKITKIQLPEIASYYQQQSKQLHIFGINAADVAY